MRGAGAGARRRAPVRPRRPIGHRAAARGGEVGQQHHVLDAGQAVEDAPEHLGAVEVAPAVAVAVDREHDLGLDLREAVDHAARAELGRGAGPDRADRGGGEEGDERPGDVGHVGHDAVAALNAERAHAACGGRDGVAQLAPRQLALRAQL